MKKKSFKLIIFWVLMVLAVLQASEKIFNNEINEPIINEGRLVAEANPTDDIKVSVNNNNVSDNNLYQVVRVVDGDTLVAEINGKQETIRLIGINTPETVDPRKPVECFGKEASAKARELLNGQKIFLQADDTQGERDKYNRLLRYVFLTDGTNFNELMIKLGFAYEYTYNVPYQYQTQFKQAQAQAQADKRGLWAEEACGKIN